jgi:hypothetical protein
MDILSVLPLLKGWEYSGAAKKKGVIITKKQSLLALEGKGYLLWALAKVDDPRAELTFTNDQKVLTNSLKTAIGIFGAGLTVPNPTGIWCPLFDFSNDAYTIVFAPPSPWPFTKSLDITLEPTDEKPNLLLYTFDHSIAEIVDEALFKQGLLDLSSSAQPIPKQG